MPRGSGPIGRPEGSTNANKHNTGGSRANSGRKKKIVTATIGTSKLSTFSQLIIAQKMHLRVAIIAIMKVKEQRKKFKVTLIMN